MSLIDRSRGFALDHGARGHEGSDLFVRKPKNFRQDLEAVFPENRCGASRAAFVALNSPLVAGIGDAAHLRMVERLVKSAMRVLGITQEVAAALNDAGGDADRLKGLHDVAGLAGPRPFGDPLVQCVVTRHAVAA